MGWGKQEDAVFRSFLIAPCQAMTMTIIMRCFTNAGGFNRLTAERLWWAVDTAVLQLPTGTHQDSVVAAAVVVMAWAPRDGSSFGG